MPRRNFLAFDLGAESGRTLLGSLEDGKLTLEEKHRFPNPTSRINGHLHWNLLGQWEELKVGLRKAAGEGKAGSRPPQIHGLGVDTWGVDFGLIGRDGDVLGSPFHYRDLRTDGMLERAFAKVPREKIFEQTGIQFMQFNTLYQLLAMREGKSQLLDCAQTMLFMPDLFNYLFTGVAKAEMSIASTGQMVDPRSGKWAIGLLEALDLPTRILPDIVPSGTVIGPLCADVAKECGVGRIPVIAPGCHDTASAIAAVPAVDGAAGDWCYVSSGTWSLMGVELNAPLIDEKTLKYNYTNEGGVGGTVRFLKNIMGLWLVQECRRQWQREGYDHSYAELTAMASRAKGFGAVIDPEHKPFALLGEMPGKIEQFCQSTKQRPPNTRGEYVRCCLESLALTYRRTLEGLQDVLGRTIGTIHIVGGGCQNELLNQMTADACQRTVLAGPVEATAIGNILTQAMATGDMKNLAEVRQVVRNSFELKRYEPKQTKQWEDAYRRYVEVTARP